MTPIQRQELMRDKTLSELTHKHRSVWERSPFMFINGRRNLPPPNRHRVFVYGTLKSGYGNSRLLEGQGSQFLANASLKGYIMFNCGSFPALVRAPHPDWRVFGELYEVEPSTLARLDQLEGVDNNFYRRVEVELEDGDGKAYVYTQPSERWLIDGRAWYPSGRWSPGAAVFHWKEGTEHTTQTLLEAPGPRGPRLEERPRISEKPPVTPPHHSAHPMASYCGPVKGSEQKLLSAPKPKIELQVGPGVEEAAPDSEVA